MMKFFKTTLCLLLTAFALAIAVNSCEKAEEQGTDSIVEPETPVPDVNVPAVQSKYYLSASDDLQGMVTAQTAGMKVLLMDSKFYAVDERVLSVSFSSDKTISRVVENGVTVSESKTVTMAWASKDPVKNPKVGRSGNEGEYGMLCLPGRHVGKFTVKTNRYTYEFKMMVTLTAGQISSVTLDFADPLAQPKRKVGVLGDSISSFDGELCNVEYSPYYPQKDPNVTANPSIAVNAKERTYWWMLINNYMQSGVLDVNSSWSGTRVIHETTKGRKSGQYINSGFVDRAYDFVDPDIIIIHGGTNDKNLQTELGEYTWDLPIGQGDLSKFRSAYIELIKKLQNRYEGVQIIIIIGDTLPVDFETSIIQIANHFSLPYVNFVGMPVDKCQGTHPTYPAFDMMARTIYNKCKDYLP